MGSEGWGQWTRTQGNPLRLPSEVRTARANSTAVTRGFQPAPAGGAAAEPELTLEQQDEVIAAVREFAGQ